MGARIEEDADRDVEWLYAAAMRLGIMPAEEDEDTFVQGVSDAIKKDRMTEIAARNHVLRQMYGKR